MAVGHHRRYCRPMAMDTAAGAQIRVTFGSGTSLYDLRYYSSEEYVVPAWWVGIASPDGELFRTAVLSGADRGPLDVLRWLEGIVGTEAAEHLVQSARDAARQSRPESVSAG